MRGVRTWVLVAVFALLLALAGCALSPVDFGITLSSRPQFGIQGCVLAAEPIVVGQTRPDAYAYGFSQGYLLLGARVRSAYAKAAGVS
ncbi:MAG TPA: hypothetical protein PLE19_12750 [Planctomycetota bacterium]|nr:hypothetical protein [Planctomycetota bacterium]HRT95760.1 hypothetical protein [Planctomycetota bacterium]